MASNISISIPVPMQDWVRAQVNTGSYGNVSEYFRDLVRRDQKEKAQARLEELLLEGLNSGEPTPWTKTDLEEIRARVIGRLKGRD